MTESGAFHSSADRARPSEFRDELTIAVKPRTRGDCAPGMESFCGGTGDPQAADELRSSSACGLLRRVRALGRGNGGHPEVRSDDQVAVRISSSIAIRLPRQPPGRDHDAYSFRIWLHAGEPGPN